MQWPFVKISPFAKTSTTAAPGPPADPLHSPKTNLLLAKPPNVGIKGAQPAVWENGCTIFDLDAERLIELALQ